MSKQAAVTTLQPVPYFPVVAPLPAWAKPAHREWEDLRIDHLPMFYFPRYLKSLDGLWLYRSIRRRLAELQRMGRADVVDAHFGYPEGVGALRAARELGIPFFVTLRGFEVEYLQKRLIGSQLRHLLRHADGCICVSDFLRSVVVNYGACPNKVRVIHNAIDRRRFYPGEKAAARRNAGLPVGVPIVISIGHVALRKRHHVLISAFATLLTKFPRARLLIIGGTAFEPDYMRRLQAQVQQLGVAEAVEFLGNIDAARVADLLRAADVFALGTQREGCCNAVLEALACGVPVVTTPVGDNSLFVEDGENGYLVPVDDSAAMQQMVTAVLEASWDPVRISLKLQVGDWNRVASEVCSFFVERR